MRDHGITFGHLLEMFAVEYLAPKDHPQCDEIVSLETLHALGVNPYTGRLKETP